jgi:HD-GYP domain-containing protein (c-di-GMP phosphodiesterase class II)
MPLLIPTDELRPGMSLVEPIVSSGQVMMQSGRALTDTDVENLRRRFPDARVRVSDPLLDQAVEFEDDTREREVAAEAQRRVANCMSQVGQRFAGRMSAQDVDFNALQAAVRELMAHLEKNPVSAALVAQCTDSSTYLGLHTGNVFYLTMLLGAAAMHLIIAERKRVAWAREAKQSFAQDLTPLGLGVLLMDIGLMSNPKILEKQEPLTTEERQLLHDHAHVGADLLPQSINAVSRMVVRMHHENCTGFGFPKGQPREKLDIFARIVRIADAYDTAISDAIFKEARSPARALWEMTCGPCNRFYDPELMRIFSRLIQPFPIGAKLRLNDGRQAAVVRYNRKNPFDPQVVVAFDARNQPLPKEQLEGPALVSEAGFQIASMYGEELGYIYQTAEQPPPRGGRDFTTPFEAGYP